MTTNLEQLEAHKIAVEKRNPNKCRIDELLEIRRQCEEEISALRSEEEKTVGLLAFFKNIEEADSQVEQLSNQELAEVVLERIIADMDTRTLEYSLLAELLRRIGYEYHDDESSLSN